MIKNIQILREIVSIGSSREQSSKNTQSQRLSVLEKTMSFFKMISVSESEMMPPRSRSSKGTTQYTNPSGPQEKVIILPVLSNIEKGKGIADDFAHFRVAIPKPEKEKV